MNFKNDYLFNFICITGIILLKFTKTLKKERSVLFNKVWLAALN